MSGETVVSAADPAIPGWYGKIPYLGDFASRRLPQAFIDAWDTWLRHSLAASRATLGVRWLEVYLNSPIWRFALMPGLVEETAWAGLVMPSVDKVGRHFPLTLAAPIEGRGEVIAAALAAAEDWYAQLERVALAVLDIDFSPEQLESEMAALPFPAQSEAAPDLSAAQLAQWWQGSASGCLIVLPEPDALPELLTAAAHRLFAAAGSGKTLWWTVAPAGGPTPLYCFTGLPPEDRYAALLQGTQIFPETTPG